MSDRSIPPLDSLLEHRSWVRAVARRLLRDEHAAEDLAQEAWLRVMRSPPDPERDPKPWLRRVLKNLASNRRRGEARRTKRETAWRPTPSQEGRAQRTPAELVAEAEQHRRLVGHVLDLEEPFKTALVLRFYEGLGPSEIAERLGIPVGTVHSRVARATERLKARLDEEEHGDRTRWIAALLPLAGFERYVPAATAGTVATTSLAGVLLMTLTKPKVALLTVLLLGCLVGGGLWLASDSDGDAQRTSLVDVDTMRGPELNTRGKALTAKAEAPTALEADTPPPTTSGAALRGRVVDARGEPVPGAAVFVLPKDAPGVHRDEIRQPRFGLVTTGEDGAFETHLGTVKEPRLIAWHAEYLAGWTLLSEVDTSLPITLTLRDPRELRLHVDAPGGMWPERLHVSVATVSPGVLSYTWDETRQYWSDGVDPWEGELEPDQVMRVATGMPLQVDVREPDGWVAIPKSARLPADATKHTIKLVRSAQLTVRVVDASTGAAPQEDKELVFLIERNDDESLSSNMSLPVRDGMVEVRSGLAPGEHTLYVTVTGYESYKATIRIDDVGAQIAHTARIEKRAAADASGPVTLRVAEGPKAPEALRRLADSRTRVPVAINYQVLVRKQGESEWDTVVSDVQADGTIAIRSDHSLAKNPGLQAGVYDLYVAKRDTGTAALVKGVRIYADQENEIDVRLTPGTMVRMGDLLDLDTQHEDVRFAAKGVGTLPVLTWSRDGGTWSITNKEGVGYLLRVPVEPHVLGPFPVSEVEVTVTPKDGKPVVKRFRGASELQR